MRFSRIGVVTVLLAALVPRTVNADGLFIPFAGVNFGGDADTDLSDAFDASRFNWGVSVGWMGAGVVGVEGDFAYSQDFFGKTDIGGSSLLTMMGNLVVGVPFGGQRGFGVRPYVLVGLGVVKPDGDAFDNPLDFGDYRPSWDFGGGVLIFFADHVGIRGDIRYFRTFEAVELFDLDAGDAGDLDFTRGSLGFVFRF